ncbi:hypothetical protein CR513_16442, partial [Mucuna pruriens]
MEVTLIRAKIVESQEATMPVRLNLNFRRHGKGEERGEEKLLKKDKKPKKWIAPFKDHKEELSKDGIHCFSMPNKRTMILRDNEDIKNEFPGENFNLKE